LIQKEIDVDITNIVELTLLVKASTRSIWDYHTCMAKYLDGSEQKICLYPEEYDLYVCSKSLLEDYKIPRERIIELLDKKELCISRDFRRDY
jgi:hypothetical protein